MMMTTTMSPTMVPAVTVPPAAVPDGADGIRRDTPGAKASGFFYAHLERICTVRAHKGRSVCTKYPRYLIAGKAIAGTYVERICPNGVSEVEPTSGTPRVRGVSQLGGWCSWSVEQMTKCSLHRRRRGGPAKARTAVEEWANRWQTLRSPSRNICAVFSSP